MTAPIHANEDEIEAILQVQNQFWKALQAQDRRALEELLADDFVARSPGQVNQTPASFIDTLVSFPARVLSVGSDNLEVHRFGDIGVVTGVQWAQLELPNGNVIRNTIAITSILQRFGIQWRMKLSHAVELV